MIVKRRSIKRDNFFTFVVPYQPHPAPLHLMKGININHVFKGGPQGIRMPSFIGW